MVVASGAAVGTVVGMALLDLQVRRFQPNFL